jgi:hypothetical protein
MWIGLLAGMLLAAATAMLIRWYRARSWSASRFDSDTPADVVLVGGPWSGRSVHLKATPRQGAVLSTSTWGLVGGGVHRGNYEVVESGAGQASASWTNF